LPSHQENFGISVAEALACGMPVLITNKVNIWKEVQAGSAGYVEDDTSTGIENLLRRWKALSREELELASRNARDLYVRSFSIEASAQSIFDEMTSNQLDHHSK
jgi:glycosyltransferase involved in cell wall biosynthesis